MRKYLVVRHRIRNYAQWKQVFDKHLDLCAEYGMKRMWVNRSADDRNELIVTAECEDLARAREFVRSASLKDAMKEAGVVDEPTIFFLEEIAEVPELVPAGHGAGS